MMALRGIGSPESVPELVKRLDDNNPEVQYLAVITLWEIVRRPDEVGPGIPMFNENKAHFIESWKRWWNETGKAQYAPAPKR